MAGITIQTDLDDDLKAVFNNGHMLDAVRLQLIRLVGGDKVSDGLDADLKPVYLIDAPLYKELACEIQVLRIVQKAKAATPAVTVSTAAPAAPAAPAATPPAGT